MSHDPYSNPHHYHKHTHTHTYDVTFHIQVKHISTDDTYTYDIVSK